MEIEREREVWGGEIETETWSCELRGAAAAAQLNQNRGNEVVHYIVVFLPSALAACSRGSGIAV